MNSEIKDAEDLRRSRRMLLRQAVLWLVMAGILGFLFTRIPIQAVWLALDRIEIEVFLVLMVGLTATSLITDSLAYWLAMRRISGDSRVGLRSAIELRAASYLMSNLNYAAGQGTLVFLLWRKVKVPVSEGVSIVLLITAMNVLVLCLLVGLGVLIGELPSEPLIRTFVTIMLIAAPAYFLVVFLKPAILQRIRFIEPLLRIGLTATVGITGARALHVMLWLAGHLAVLYLFDVQIPIDDALVHLPLVFLIAAMPITPAGVGTAQAAAILLLSEFAPGNTAQEREAVVLAYSLAFQALSIALQSLVAVYFARKLTVQ